MKKKAAVFSNKASLPTDSVLMLGVSMKSQNKLKGENLELIANLCNSSNSKLKYVYLGDTLHAINISSQQIIAHVKEKTELNNEILDALDAKFHLTESKENGDDWIDNHKKLFSENCKIDRHSTMEKQENFSAFFLETCKWYSDDENSEYTEQVNNTIKAYLSRFISHNKKDGKSILHWIRKVSYDGSNRSLTNDPINKAVHTYIKLHQSTAPELNKENENKLCKPDYDNVIMRELIKNSLRYVLGELAGFRTSATLTIINQRLHPETCFYFAYPGKLSVVEAYFNLVKNVNMKTMTIKFQKNNALEFSDQEYSCSSSDEDSSATLSSSPPEEDKVASISKGFFGAIIDAGNKGENVDMPSMKELFLDLISNSNAPKTKKDASPKSRESSISAPETMRKPPNQHRLFSDPRVGRPNSFPPRQNENNKNRKYDTDQKATLTNFNITN